MQRLRLPRSLIIVTKEAEPRKRDPNGTTKEKFSRYYLRAHSSCLGWANILCYSVSELKTTETLLWRASLVVKGCGKLDFAPLAWIGEFRLRQSRSAAVHLVNDDQVDSEIFM